MDRKQVPLEQSFSLLETMHFYAKPLSLWESMTVREMVATLIASDPF